MGIESIRWGLPFCESVTEQTECSLITRTALVGLGGIALLVGIFALSGIPGLNALGTSEGIILTSLGGLTLLIGLCIRSVKENSIGQNAEHNSTTPENQLSTREKTGHIEFSNKNFEVRYLDILAITFRHLSIENISVVARVSIAWYYASKRENLWHFYLFREGNLSNCKKNSYESQYKNRKLNEIFDRYVLKYLSESDPLLRLARNPWDDQIPDTTQLDTSWQKLIEFTARYPEFEDKLPENINLNLALTRAFFSSGYWCVTCIEDLLDFIDELSHLTRHITFALEDFKDDFDESCRDILWELEDIINAFLERFHRTARELF